jgi:Raf kinase inhibitor-like YbhB/YbcL family protein
MDLTSSAFDAGGTIPARYTCDGENGSPALEWSSVPPEAQSLLLIVDDPDSANGPWSHWVLYNIPPEQGGLSEGIQHGGQLSWGAVQGRNDFGDAGYGGPCPGHGATHRYYFRLYALGEKLDLSPGATRAQVMDRIHGQVLDSTELMARYTRG